MPWTTMLMKGNRVLARCDEGGRPLAAGGRVEIRYKPSGKAYQASPRNLSPVDGAPLLPDSHCAPAEAAPKPKAKRASGGKSSPASGATSPPHEPGAIIVYADGACSGNPGPAGLGVVILDGDRREELSEYLGQGTNNIGELAAIQRAAERLKGRSEPVRIYTDSKYSINMLTKSWKAKKNQALIASVKAALAELPDVALYYVPGHAGIDLNERADALATGAVRDRATAGWSDA